MIRIQANELRIGNNIYWLHEESESILTVDAEMISGIDDFNRFPDKDEYARGMSWSAIPLEPEILDRTNFVRHEYTSHKSNPYLPPEILAKDYFDYRLAPFIVEFNNGGARVYINYSDNIIEYNHIQYLHELQNLYYALTKTELVYQPKPTE